MAEAKRRALAVFDAFVETSGKSGLGGMSRHASPGDTRRPSYQDRGVYCSSDGAAAEFILTRAKWSNPWWHESSSNILHSNTEDIPQPLFSLGKIEEP
jgi:hypothetical protein